MILFLIIMKNSDSDKESIHAAFNLLQPTDLILIHVTGLWISLDNLVQCLSSPLSCLLALGFVAFHVQGEMI